MKSLKIIEEIKNTWEEYASLIKTLAAIFFFIAAGVGAVSGVLIKGMMNDVVQEETGQVKAVTDLTDAVNTLTATVEANTKSSTRLDDTVKILQGDVTDIHKHLAGIRVIGDDGG